MSVLGEVGASQLGHRLAQLREQAGLKQAELARQVTWSQAVVSRIEAGDRHISDDELQTLLAAIGTPQASDLAGILGREWVILPRPPLDHPDQELLWHADQVASRMTELADEPDTRQAFERRLREYIEEIARLAGLILRREHNIAFIGSIGIGKSTAICRVTQLEVEGKLRPAPVLETGGGGVTLCEVHLHKGPGYGVLVEPRTHDEIRADVTDFVDQLTRVDGSVSERSDADSEALRAVPREIERAIRNMASLQPKRTKGQDGKTVRSDPAKELARAIPSQRELVVEILARMELHRRDRRDAWFDPSLAPDPMKWIKETFEQVNNGRHPDFSLPARIELVVPNLIELGDLDVGIVDTRGIDQLTARADLEAHLEDPHTVAVLCSGFNDAPEQCVHHLLQRAREIGNVQVDSNATVLVLPRPDEAMAVKDESGIPVESSEEGYELKGEQVTGALSPHGFDRLPVGFFNAFEDESERLRTFLSDRIAHTRSEFCRRLEDVLTNAHHLLSNVELEQVAEVQREAGRHVRSWIGNHASPTDVDGHVQDTLLTEIASAHASTVRAAVRREGEWQSLSYSHQLGHGARRLAVASLGKSVDAFTDLCETLTGSLPEAAELLSQASRLMSQVYSELLRRVQLGGQMLYREQLQQDTRLWAQCESEWGRGSGYRDRIASHNRTWFAGQPRIDLEGELWTVVTREWSSVLERVESIFETA